MCFSGLSHCAAAARRTAPANTPGASPARDVRSDVVVTPHRVPICAVAVLQASARREASNWRACDGAAVMQTLYQPAGYAITSMSATTYAANITSAPGLQRRLVLRKENDTSLLVACPRQRQRGLIVWQSPSPSDPRHRRWRATSERSTSAAMNTAGAGAVQCAQALRYIQDGRRWIAAVDLRH